MVRLLPAHAHSMDVACESHAHPVSLYACATRDHLRASQPFKMTAQLYSDCWRERVDRENRSMLKSLTETDDEPDLRAAVASSRAPASNADPAEIDDDAVSVVGSIASHRSGASRRSTATKCSVARSDVSSNVSTNSATVRKLKLLEQELEKEQQKRKELEELLKVKLKVKTLRGEH